jgi:pimeloyl-ACP methyl ester carboxylesterase
MAVWALECLQMSFFRMFQRTGRTVHLLDARNHGKSGRSLDMTYFHLASDVRQFCHDHRISQAVFVGNVLARPYLFLKTTL